MFHLILISNKIYTLCICTVISYPKLIQDFKMLRQSVFLAHVNKKNHFQKQNKPKLMLIAGILSNILINSDSLKDVQHRGKNLTS